MVMRSYKLIELNISIRTVKQKK